MQSDQEQALTEGRPSLRATGGIPGTVVPTEKTSSTYRPELDGIRAIAVVMVIINHFSESALPSGFLGVDVFFVLSGYVVSGSIAHRSTANWTEFLTQFYARRVRRIVPALLGCVSITGFVGCLFVPYPEATLAAGLYSLVGASNIYFYIRSGDYFGEDARHNLFTHTWSLGVEEQFYLVFPLVFVLATSRKVRETVGDAITPLLALLGALSLALWLYIAPREPSFAYFMLPSRFWELGLGCLVFFVSGGGTAAGRLAGSLSVIALASLVSIPFLPQQQMRFATAGICLATAALIWSMDPRGWVVKVLSNAWLVRVGILSYSLYLWHWPVISISRYTIGISANTILIQVALIIALATFSYLFIERPFRYGKPTRRSGLVLVTGAVAIASSAFFLQGLALFHARLFSADKPRFNISRATFLLEPTFEQCTTVDEFDLSAFPPTCFFKPTASNGRTLWLLGDSTTWALKGMASEVSRTTGSAVVMFADDSAFPSAELGPASENGARHEQARRYFVKVFAYVTAFAGRGDVVMVTANLAAVFCETPELYCTVPAGEGPVWRSPDGELLSNKDGLSHFLEEMNDLAAALGNRGATLILSAPLPRWEREHRVHCERQWFRPAWETSKCGRPNHAEQLQTRERLVSVISGSTRPGGFLLYDPFPYLCNETSCDFSNPLTNENYWTDETHLSTSGGARLAPHFLAFLKSKALLAR